MNLQSQARGDYNPAAGHRWRTLIHADGCHFFTSSFRCDDCGAQLHTHDERDLSGDPWSMVWMTGDDGDTRCDRCTELLDGAEPESRMVYLGGRRAAH